MRLERDGRWHRRTARRSRSRPGRPDRRRRRLAGPARAVRRGRDRPGPARAARRALRRRGRPRVGAVHGQGRLQGRAGRGRRPPGRLRRGRGALRERPDAVREALRALGLRVRQARPPGSSVGIVMVVRRTTSTPRSTWPSRTTALVWSRSSAPASKSSAPSSASRPTRVSVPGEIVLPSGADWYDYEAKYTDGDMCSVPPGSRTPCQPGPPARRRDVPARGCSGLARVDFFIEDGRVLVNEVNTMPGLHAHQRLPEALGGVRPALPAVLRPPARARVRAPPRPAR